MGRDVGCGGGKGGWESGWEAWVGGGGWVVGCKEGPAQHTLSPRFRAGCREGRGGGENTKGMVDNGLLSK